MNFDQFSPLTQILLVFAGLGLLFFLVMSNNKRNKDKRAKRSSKSFRQRIKERKEEREES
ncbi:MAG: hypothetical protein ACTH6S_11330 [Mesonia sp.]|uniref:hypothetical protein n=1 Tax=Mesonia sp. TaxID=1960830 RepID=UPI003F9C1B58